MEAPIILGHLSDAELASEIARYGMMNLLLMPLIDDENYRETLRDFLQGQADPYYDEYERRHGAVKPAVH